MIHYKSSMQLILYEKKRSGGVQVAFESAFKLYTCYKDALECLVLVSFLCYDLSTNFGIRIKYLLKYNIETSYGQLLSSDYWLTVLLGEKQV